MWTNSEGKSIKNKRHKIIAKPNLLEENKQTEDSSSLESSKGGNSIVSPKEEQGRLPIRKRYGRKDNNTEHRIVEQPESDSPVYADKHEGKVAIDETQGCSASAAKVQQESSLVWFRGHDLRIDDNPALFAALERNVPCYAIFVWSPEPFGRWYPSKPWLWWLHRSLLELERELITLGVKLLCRKGLAEEQLPIVARETGATVIFWNRAYEPVYLKTEERVISVFSGKAVSLVSFKSELLVEPWELQNENSPFFPNFHSYMRAWMLRLPPPEPVSIQKQYYAFLPYESLENQVEFLDLLSKEDIEEFESKTTWKPGCREARRTLKMFLINSFDKFGEARYRRSLMGTSKLSPHLKFGELSVKRIFHIVRKRLASKRENWYLYSQSAKAFLKNLCLREYAYHLLYYYPNAVDTPLQSVFNLFPWERDYSLLERWSVGHTGYPMVDAAIRELRVTGWIHNILRFLLASFLTRYLLLPWQLGAHFLYTHLIDGDLAANTLGWQWTAGCNTDSFPLSCLVNPVGMGRRYDSSGAYVRQWLPELASLPDKYIHCPWQAPEEVLSNANIVLGKTYPFPIIDASFARNRAKEALRIMKQIVDGQHLPKSPSSPTVNDVIEEWPDEVREADRALEEAPLTEQGSSALSLLPSLWQLLQHDSPPSFPATSLEHLLFNSENEDDELMLNDLSFQNEDETSYFHLENRDDSVSYMTNKLDQLTAAQSKISNFVGSYSPPMNQNQASQAFIPTWMSTPYSAQERRNYSEDIHLEPAVDTQGSNIYRRIPSTEANVLFPYQRFGENGILESVPLSFFYGSPSYRKNESYSSESRVPDATSSIPSLPSAKRKVKTAAYSPVSRADSRRKFLDLPFFTNDSSDTSSVKVEDSQEGSREQSGTKRGRQADAKRKQRVSAFSTHSCSPLSKQQERSMQSDETRRLPQTSEERRAVLESVAKDSQHEGQLFAQFLVQFYILTDNVDRRSSRDFVRVRNIKDSFHRWCPDKKKLLKIYKIKSFLSDVLNLEVTGEWDRHQHGGVRGPYVYGICPMDQSM